MVDWIHFVTSMVSASVAVLAGLAFVLAYMEERKRTRVMWGMAFILYAIGHLINSWLFSPQFHS